jgi:glutathione S-transferase
VVPTLVADGTPRGEAAALAMWLAEQYPGAQLAPAAGDPRRAAYLQWMLHMANELQPLFRQWWYPGEPAGEAHRDAVQAHCAPRIEAHWQRIDAHLAAHGPWLLGDGPTVADFYLAMLMRWSGNMPRPATDWPRLAALATAIRSRPSFAELYAREGLTEWA